MRTRRQSSSREYEEATSAQLWSDARDPLVFRAESLDSCWSGWISPEREALEVSDLTVRRGSQAVDGTGL